MGSELVWPVYLGVISLTVALLSVGVMWVRGVHLVWSSIGLAASGLGAWAAFVMLWDRWRILCEAVLKTEL